MATPKLTFYTNHGCGWSHSVHIVLRELSLPYEEVLMDLDKPRPEWFLQLNPRGLVPVLRYKTGDIDQVLTESALIVQFLIELHPSHIAPQLDSDDATALFRWRMNFFNDTWFKQVNPLIFKLLGAADAKQQEQKVDELVAAVAKEIEPLLEDADPFFGGSQDITKAEALVIPFVLRIYDFADDIIWPATVVKKLDGLENFSKWARHGMKHESVMYVWDKEYMVPRIIERLPAAKAKYASGQ